MNSVGGVACTKIVVRFSLQWRALESHCISFNHLVSLTNVLLWSVRSFIAYRIWVNHRNWAHSLMSTFYCFVVTITRAHIFVKSTLSVCFTWTIFFTVSRSWGWGITLLALYTHHHLHWNPHQSIQLRWKSKIRLGIFCGLIISSDFISVIWKAPWALLYVHRSLPLSSKGLLRTRSELLSSLIYLAQ